jgi:Icc-related predicted phosphoesterase
MALCFFVSDLHGNLRSYQVLIDRIRAEMPTAVFLGGDLTPVGLVHREPGGPPIRYFVPEYLIPTFRQLKAGMGPGYPRVFLILGNDDGKAVEADIQAGEQEKLWDYIHGRMVPFGEYRVYGYAYVPPTPFRLKDWERYDISRYVEPGCIPPEEGWHSVPVARDRIPYESIQGDLHQLSGEDDLTQGIFLFHAPPYQTNLDRAALDGQRIEHVPLDVHVGSIAMRRWIEKRQPKLTLHGHIHESTRLTGKWQDKIGETTLFSAAHDGPDLALVRFDPQRLGEASRELIPWGGD